MYINKEEDILKAKNGCKESLGFLIENNSNLVWSIVNRFKNRGYDMQDLFQIGCIGLIKSIKKFEPSFEVQLSTYAVPYIIGEIKRFIRDDGPVKVSRSTKELAYKIKLTQEENLNKKGKDIKVEELARILNVGVDEIIMAMESSNCVESIDAKIGDNEDFSILDKVSTAENEENKVINKIIIENLIDDLGEKEKKLIMLRYYRGKTQKQIAEYFGTTQVQISRLEKKILGGMKKSLVDG